MGTVALATLDRGERNVEIGRGDVRDIVERAILVSELDTVMGVILKAVTVGNVSSVTTSLAKLSKSEAVWRF